MKHLKLQLRISIVEVRELLKLKSTAIELLAEKGHNTGQNPQREGPLYLLSLIGLVNVLSLAHWKLGRRNCLKSGHVLKDCKVDRACAHCGKKGSHHRNLCNMYVVSVAP